MVTPSKRTAEFLCEHRHGHRGCGVRSEWINRIDIRHEERIGIYAPQLQFVLLDRTRVLFVIFAFAELCRVDEYRDDDPIRVLPGHIDQIQMTGVQIPHRRHQGDLIARPAPLADLFP